LIAAGYTAVKSHKQTGKVDIMQTISAGASGFLAVYSLGTLVYGMYETYCYSNSVTPVTEIGGSPADVISNNGSVEHPTSTNITGYTKHGLKQAMGRDSVGVKPSAILDAVRNPIEVEARIDELGRISNAYYGVGATVVLNPAGKVVTTWATTSQYWRLSIR